MHGGLLGGIVVLVAAMAVVTAITGMRQLAGATGRESDDTYTIDVNETGFTPRSCKINRNDSIRFRNAGTAPRRVIKPDVFANQPPIYDTGLLKPGEVSHDYIFVYGSTEHFFDAADASHEFVVLLPVLVEKWDEVCLGNPVAPTATPTVPGSPSPAASASPSASPSATPSTTVTPQVGVRCRGYSACVVTMAVASDR